MELGWGLAGRVGFVLVEGREEGSAERSIELIGRGSLRGVGGVIIRFRVPELM